MYGTVARIKVKPGKFAEGLKEMEKQSQEAAGEGAVEVMVYRSDNDPNELYMIAVFEDKEKYFANAERPETNANYEKMAQFFASEPEWHDGEVIYYKKFD